MGVIRNQETHLKRSSSMSLSLRWKHENFRLISITALISVFIISVFLLLLYGTSVKHVTLVMNGQEKKVMTRQWVMERFLKEQGISVGAHDRFSPSLNSKIVSGDRIAIEHSVPIQLTADGETKTVYTIGKTVESALQDLNISLGNFDKITPDLNTNVFKNMAVKIVRVRKVIDEVTEPIQYQTVKKYDAGLLAGKEQTVQEGKEGVLVKKKVKLFEDGALVAENIVNQSVKSGSINKIVAVGTKKSANTLSASSENAGHVSKNELNFPVKHILKNVTLTAYTAGFASTGKRSGDPQYGVTFTGTHVSEGRTIAVDPKIIPLGWWVYIEGIGFRRAEDTGSAIKGQKIDVYFNSESYAKRFGVKHGFTVYVIGPQKPSI
jgi:uncharacterized protein YabE (DUF348 family)/3D (Asp-Asp-Asp) domain-containing protein